MARAHSLFTLAAWRDALLAATVGAASILASLAAPSLAASALAATVAPPTNSGKVVPIDINDRTKELGNGKSSTQFILKLPDGVFQSVCEAQWTAAVIRLGLWSLQARLLGL